VSATPIWLAFFWALAEGTVWPIMPDAALVPLALARPASWRRLVLAAALGTAAGGAISYLLGRRSPERASVERLALVRPAMVTAVDGWLAREGARGVWRQPATGVPFKVFARRAGARELSVIRFFGWALLSRSIRFALLAGIAALVGARVSRWYWPITGLWALVFGAALWRLVAFWSRRGDEAGERP
jgi:membrane protein YqaA with SNARE-associated domain